MIWRASLFRTIKEGCTFVHHTVSSCLSRFLLVAFSLSSKDFDFCEETIDMIDTLYFGSKVGRLLAILLWRSNLFWKENTDSNSSFDYFVTANFEKISSESFGTTFLILGTVVTSSSHSCCEPMLKCCLQHATLSIIFTSTAWCGMQCLRWVVVCRQSFRSLLAAGCWLHIMQKMFKDS